MPAISISVSCVAVCCSVLQCVLQYVADPRHPMEDAWFAGDLDFGLVYCIVLQCVAVRCSVSQIRGIQSRMLGLPAISISVSCFAVCVAVCIAMWCSVLPCVLQCVADPQQPMEDSRFTGDFDLSPSSFVAAKACGSYACRSCRLCTCISSCTCTCTCTSTCMWFKCM